jgi:hypothetical protein
MVYIRVADVGNYIKIIDEINKMISLNNCPICGGVWKPSENLNSKGKPLHSHMCAKCDMVYNSNFLARRNILKANYAILWDFENNTCVYGNQIDILNEACLKLPWLDFNITPDKLKLYILFS